MPRRGGQDTTTRFVGPDLLEHIFGPDLWTRFLDQTFGLDWNYLASLMRSPAWIFDTRSVVNRHEIKETALNLWKLGEAS